MRLGDLGAEVIKVEYPAGDLGRGFMKVIGAMAGLEGKNFFNTDPISIFSLTASRFRGKFLN